MFHEIFEPLVKDSEKMVEDLKEEIITTQSIVKESKKC